MCHTEDRTLDLLVDKRVELNKEKRDNNLLCDNDAMR